MAGILGLCSAGLLGFGSYKCFDIYAIEAKHSAELKAKLTKSIVPFELSENLIGNTIVKVTLGNPVYYYSISQLYKTKYVEVKERTYINMRTGVISDIAVPVEVESTRTSFLSHFLSDPTFGKSKIVQDGLPQLMFTRSHVDIGHFNGSYLSDMLLEKHDIRAMFGGNLDMFEVKSTKLDTCVYLLGQVEGENFRYSVVSDNCHALIDKVVSDQDESGGWFAGGTVLLFGAVASLLFAVTEGNK